MGGSAGNEALGVFRADRPRQRRGALVDSAHSPAKIILVRVQVLRRWSGSSEGGELRAERAAGVGRRSVEGDDGGATSRLG